MQAMHQKSQVGMDYPLHVFVSVDQEFPPHWHEAVEIIYALEDDLRVGINHEIHSLKVRDILLVGGGDVHFFPPQTQPVKRMIIQFDLAFFETFAALFRDKRFTVALLRENVDPMAQGAAGVHADMEQQLLAILRESDQKQEGYKLALKARMYDLLIILLRRVPMELISPHEKNRRLGRLERLELVLRHVESHYDRVITLDEVALLANFSVFHFTRFFRETTGMTFGQYVNQFRVEKAVDYLINTNDTITEIVFKSGFNSAKTFNRVFRQIKGCSPSAYKRSLSDV